jgi:predicted nucleic acid-binding protein
MIRVYADTSVFGGIFDAEFERASKAFFKAVQEERYTLVTSVLVARELHVAPRRVREFFRKVGRVAERIRISAQALELRDAYVAAGIVRTRWEADALHVAIATVSACPLLISWNCKHIVHFEKIPKYNAVNRLRGYGDIAIHTPLEVVADEDDEEGV